MADSDILGADQYLRACQLIVYDTNLNGLDLSALRIKFSVKRTDTATPNTADIKVYNLSDETALSILQNLSPAPGMPNRGSVLLQAGYAGNFGVIFQGNIKQIIIGRESATDTFLNIIAGDGDRAYNFAIVNTPLAAGSSQMDQLKAVVNATTPLGTTLGPVGDLPAQKLPRGKAMFGNAKNYLRNISSNSNKTWSIQDEKITFVSLTSYLPGKVVVITNATGMIGAPQQTHDGVNVKCLLNPFIQVSGRIQLDSTAILQLKLNLEQIAAAQGDVGAINNLIPRHLSADGVYYVLVLEHIGDTRGIDWYCNLVCLNLDASANPANGVTGGATG